MGIYVGYQSAGACTGGPQPGVRALMSWFLGAYADDGGVNLGIYNCRPVRGGAAPSLHGEGRAGDLGIRPNRAAWGWDLARALHDRSAELGIQCLIWDKKIWSGSYPNAGWRNYTGSADHFDHIHTELAWWAARDLTVDRIQAAMIGVAQAPPPVSNDVVRATQRAVRVPDDGIWGRGTDGAVNLVHDAVRGIFTNTANAQRVIGTPADGKWGPASRAALAVTVRALQSAWAVTADGVWGPRTEAAWAANRARYGKGL